VESRLHLAELRAYSGLAGCKGTKNGILRASGILCGAARKKDYPAYFFEKSLDTEGGLNDN